MSINIAILGSTGVVAQKLISLLSKKPQFQIAELVASDSRIGFSYGESCDWREVSMGMPEAVSRIKMTSIKDLKSEFVLSCLPSEIATVIEPELAISGKIVFSNASAFRMHADVPLLIPEINESHLSLLTRQKTKGKIITNPNCSAVGVALALAPLQDLGIIDHVSVVTLQSISGAGYPGIASLDILNNTIPHIAGEAEKITEEVKKMLGEVDKPAPFAITTHVHRVPVLFGHTATLHITFDKSVTTKEVSDLYNKWNERYNDLFVIHDVDGRPQSSKDLRDDDMRIHIGHLRQGDRNDIIGLTILSHNLVRGAAGAVIANMESYLRLK